VDGLLGGDRLAEGLALDGVAQAGLQRGLGDADAEVGHADAAELQGLHRLHEAAADGAQDVVVGELRPASKVRPPVGEPRRPSLRYGAERVTPGEARSTTKAVTPA
jgi:hypothetical protein